MDGLEGLLQGGTGTQTTIAASTSNQEALAANSSRRGLILFNNTNKECLIRFSSSAATTSLFSFKIPPDEGYDRPLPHYTGAIQVIWPSSSSGNLIVTEIT